MYVTSLLLWTCYPVDIIDLLRNSILDRNVSSFMHLIALDRVRARTSGKPIQTSTTLLPSRISFSEEVGVLSPFISSTSISRRVPTPNTKKPPESNKEAQPIHHTSQPSLLYINTYQISHNSSFSNAHNLFHPSFSDAPIGGSWGLDCL